MRTYHTRCSLITLCGGSFSQEKPRGTVSFVLYSLNYEYFFNLIEFFFNSYGVEIDLLDKKEYTEQEELVNDMMMLIASFSGKVYSLRAQENRKKRKQKENENKIT